MNIHSLFILNKTGSCIYSRNITKDFESIEPNLITPFFSAIFTFSENVIMKQTPEVIEMGGFRIVFKVKGTYIFAILSDSTASLLFINSRLESIIESFEDFLQTNEIEEYQEIENEGFDSRIDAIIAGKEEMEYSQALYRKIIEYIKELMQGDEIIGVALFSINGNIIFSSLPHEILLSSLRELEIRYMVANEFTMTFYTLENEQKVFSKIIEIPWKLDPLLLVVLFESKVPLGMAELNLDRIVKTIQNII
ncbi:MAG: hypothetical protein ACFFKA_08045 [Candidatus Thorarchaeota archaeon]